MAPRRAWSFATDATWASLTSWSWVSIWPSCWSASITPTEVSGRGAIHLTILLHQGPPAPDVDYAEGPHPVVSVELEEQEALRFTSTVIDCPLEDVRIGLPVELAWVERFGSPFPVFRARETS